MRILGIVSDTHDSGVALLEDGVPVLVIEEERLNRRKHTQRFPAQALNATLPERGLTLADIDVLTTPWDAARLRRTFGRALLGRLPHSLNLVNERTRPPQRNKIVILNQRIKHYLKKQFATTSLPPIVNVGHHDAHAAVFLVSPFEEATILVMDGYGDDASTSAYSGRGNRISRHWHTGIFNSLGIIYTLVTHYLGFAGFADEGKVMALAAFGEATYVDKFREVIKPTPDGRYTIDMSYFDFDAYGMVRPFKRKFFDAFGPMREPGSELTQRHKDVAYALQLVTEEIILHMTRALAKAHPSRNLVIAGGVGLNCVANARVLAQSGYERVWVPPIASDTGAPLGSALWHHHVTLGAPRTFVLEHAAFGCGYTDSQIRFALDRSGVEYEELGDAEMIARTARDLADGAIVGWFQGRFEMGPRALGNRSILADPRRAQMRDEINARIKKREGFRPFAPAVLVERVSEFFEHDGPDPFMTLAPRVRPDKAHLIAAGVHVDGTGRIQTVDRRHNPRYYDLIAAFGAITGVPVLLNTSFNQQEPIVARPEEAIACYQRTGMDTLVMGSFYVRKGARVVSKAWSEIAPQLAGERT